LWELWARASGANLALLVVMGDVIRRDAESGAMGIMVWGCAGCGSRLGRCTLIDEASEQADKQAGKLLRRRRGREVGPDATGPESIVSDRAVDQLSIQEPKESRRESGLATQSVPARWSRAVFFGKQLPLTVW